MRKGVRKRTRRRRRRRGDRVRRRVQQKHPVVFTVQPITIFRVDLADLSRVEIQNYHSPCSCVLNLDL